MARLDRFIQLLWDQEGDALELVPGQPVRLRRQQAIRPVTRDPLSAAQILGLAREISPPAQSAQLGGAAPVEFRYDAAAGPVRVEVHGGAEPRMLLSRDANGAGRSPAETGRMEGLLRQLAASGASDLHLRTGEPPILRRDGALEWLEQPPVGADELRAMLRTVMSPADFRRLEETGDADWAYELPETARFRGNAGMDRRGPMAVVRIIPTAIRSADELGLSPEVQRLCRLSKGLVLVTGPTGSGKSTTLAAMVDLVNRTRRDHLITIEDPIEFVHQSKQCLVTQRQVGLHTGSFKQALRAALREDPDIVLVGEMRDLETVSIAIETAETGHLVFGTLHTTTAASTIDRVIDQFPPDRQGQVRVMLSESLRGVVAQVLCPRKGGGRVAAREVLLSTPAISNLIREGKTFQIPSIMQTSRRAGMVTLNEALLELVERGEVEPREAYLKSAEKAGLLAALKAKGHEIEGEP